jgi:hypothetical protein
VDPFCEVILDVVPAGSMPSTMSQSSIKDPNEASIATTLRAHRIDRGATLIDEPLAMMFGRPVRGSAYLTNLHLGRGATPVLIKE